MRIMLLLSLCSRPLSAAEIVEPFHIVEKRGVLMTEQEYRDFAGDLFECDAKEVVKEPDIDQPVLIYLFLGGLLSGLIASEKLR